LKDENERRRSREVTRVSYDKSSRIGRRDQRRLKHGVEEGWRDEKKHAGNKRV
jgi:hypothetical protein